jgi:hypothetical protein
MREERRGPWYLITGIILGVALGLVYAWLVSPIAYVDTPPVSLRADYKDQYRTLIALAYASNGDLGRARARLALLGDPDPGPLVASQATRAAAQNHPLSEIQALALLAEALGSPVELLASTPTMTLAAPTPHLQLPLPGLQNPPVHLKRRSPHLLRVVTHQQKRVQPRLLHLRCCPKPHLPLYPP